MKRPTLTKVHLYVACAVLLAVQVLFVSARYSPAKITHPASIFPAKDSSCDPAATESITTVSLYDSLELEAAGLARDVFDMAVKGFSYIREMGTVENTHILTIIDFSKPSTAKRLFIIDLDRCKLLFNTYVAHGVNSGTLFARYFSNQPESNKSSLGFYKTTSTYNGKHGYSLHLDGLEKGFNDKAFSRDIVIHAADYVSEALIRTRGYIGRSWGCPAVLPQLCKPIIDKIKDGSCLFIYGPDNRYLSQSTILREIRNKSGQGI